MSYQVPDFLALIKCLELRTNKHCRSVSQSSESWFLHDLPAGVLSDPEQERLPSAKFGLLATLCYPTCDLPQLRLATDVITALFISNGRSGFGHRDWVSPEQTDGSEDPLRILARHGILKHILPSLARSISRMNEDWQRRLSNDLERWCSGQLTLAQNQEEEVIPLRDEYVSQRSDASALRVLFDLIELVQDLDLSKLDAPTKIKLDEAKTHLATFLSSMLDVFSYNVAQQYGNSQNLVTVLMKQDNLIAQYAINASEKPVAQSFKSFLEVEESIFPPSPEAQTGQSGLDSLLSRIWPNPTPPLNQLAHLDEATQRDLHRYIRGLKDIVAGVINWAYESELYFGKKGEDVRAFGWVFLSQPNV